jgi:hypothetical protein
MAADLQAATDKSRKRDIFEAETVAEPEDALDYINAIAPEPATTEDFEGNDEFDDQF